MSPDSPYFSLIVSHGPKWLLMAIVIIVVLPRWRRATLGARSRRLANAGLGLFAFVVLATPLLYGALRWRVLNGGGDLQAAGHALIGGVLTLAEFAGVLLLGLAIVADRDRPR